MELALEEYEPQNRLEGLAFPSGIAVDEAAGRLWIADTRHHRILAIGLQDFGVRAVVGLGWPGAADGSLQTATFFEPTALALVGSDVFVADTGNHLLRRIDLEAQTVETVLGTCRPAVDTSAGQAGLRQALNAPVGLATDNTSLFVALAGNHQVWRVDLATMQAEVLAGVDEPGQFDGPARDASLLQPGGLAVSGARLAFVDSGANSLRCLDLEDQALRTLVRGSRVPLTGAVAEVFAGDLQFPTAVAWHGGDLLIADTFRDKIRRWRKEGVLDTLAVDVHRPAALCVVGDILFIADATLVTTMSRTG